ncbi:MAG: hypothetical protein AAB664_03700, partial [Patescibacteria group bacterium]
NTLSIAGASPRGFRFAAKFEDWGGFKIQTNGIGCCVYPSKSHLATVVDARTYDGRPYTLALALGEPQLAYRALHLRVLEFYRNDPRYHYETDDVSGSTYSKADGSIDGPDDTFLETFGFAYDKKVTRRYVAAFLIYLSRLTPEHQQRWKLEEFSEDTFLHPDYAKTTAGHWPEKESIFNAFLEEERIINEMAIRCVGKPLLVNIHERAKKPKEFAFLIRPTQKEYEGFVQLLDKMISDNLDKQFFNGKIPLTKSELDPGGGVVERPKGTISLLEEWLNGSIRFPDPKPKDDMIKTFRDIRDERSKIAHHVRDDHWDEGYFGKQRDLMSRAYGAMRTLRLIFTNCPSARAVEVPDWLYKGDIWTY